MGRRQQITKVKILFGMGEMTIPVYTHLTHDAIRAVKAQYPGCIVLQAYNEWV